MPESLLETLSDKPLTTEQAVHTAKLDDLLRFAVVLTLYSKAKGERRGPRILWKQMRRGATCSDYQNVFEDQDIVSMPNAAKAVVEIQNYFRTEYVVPGPKQPSDFTAGMPGRIFNSLISAWKTLAISVDKGCYSFEMEWSTDTTNAALQGLIATPKVISRHPIILDKDQDQPARDFRTIVIELPAITADELRLEGLEGFFRTRRSERYKLLLGPGAVPRRACRHCFWLLPSDSADRAFASTPLLVENVSANAELCLPERGTPPGWRCPHPGHEANKAEWPDQRIPEGTLGPSCISAEEWPGSLFRQLTSITPAAGALGSHLSDAQLPGPASGPASVASTAPAVAAPVSVTFTSASSRSGAISVNNAISRNTVSSNSTASKDTASGSHASVSREAQLGEELAAARAERDGLREKWQAALREAQSARADKVKAEQDVSRIKATCRQRDVANSELRNEIQVLRDTVRSQDDQISQLRAREAANEQARLVREPERVSSLRSRINKLEQEAKASDGRHSAALAAQASQFAEEQRKRAHSVTDRVSSLLLRIEVLEHEARASEDIQSAALAAQADKFADEQRDRDQRHASEIDSIREEADRRVENLEIELARQRRVFVGIRATAGKDIADMERKYRAADGDNGGGCQATDSSTSRISAKEAALVEELRKATQVNTSLTAQLEGAKTDIGTLYLELNQLKRDRSRAPEAGSSTPITGPARSGFSVSGTYDRNTSRTGVVIHTRYQSQAPPPTPPSTASP